MEDGVRVLEAKLGRKLSTLKNFEQVDITLGELKREFGFAKMSDLSTFMGRVYDGSIVVDGVKLHVRSKNPDFGLKTTDSFVLSRRDDFK